MSRLSVSTPRRGDLVVLAAGASLPFAFAPFGFYPLAVLAPAILFRHLLGCSPGRAAWRGGLFGAGMFGIGVSWIVESFQYNQIALPVAVGLTALFVAALALFPAGFSYVAARWLPRRRAVALVLAYPAWWTFTEWIRAGFLTGFTWLQLGYSQIDSPLVGFAPVSGVYGISWAVALTAGLAALAFRSRWSIAAACVPGAAGLRPIPWTHAAGADLRVALIQGNIPQALKWRPEQRQPTLRRYLSLSRQNRDADLIVWPETALPGQYRRMRAFLDGLEREARKDGTEFLIGVPTRDAGGRYFNSVVSIGRERRFYHKRHLVPFGEYLPLPWLFGPPARLLGIPIPQFTHGARDQSLLSVAGYRVGVSICYEAAFGNEIIDAVPAAAFLVNVSNDAWFGDSIAPHQHLEIARMRAVETGRFMARATNTGVSAIIAPDGRLEARSPQFEAQVLTGRITPMAGSTPYTRYGDLPVVAMLLLAIGFSALRARLTGLDA